MVRSKVDPSVLPAAAAAVRHAAAVSIRTEPAGHALLPAAPDTYAPAHDGTARAAPQAVPQQRCTPVTRAAPWEYRPK